MTIKLPEGYKLVELEKTDSTNLHAERLFRSGQKDGVTVVWARHQTDGRGRQGRKWISQEGNLFSSLVFAPDTEPMITLGVSFVSAVSARDAIEEIVPSLKNKIKFKWPNDLMLDGKKLGGILLDSAMRQDLPKSEFVVAGLGINVKEAPKFSELAGTSKSTKVIYEPISLAEYNVTAEKLLESLVNNFSKNLEIWNKGKGFNEILESWKKSSALIEGSVVTVAIGPKEYTGKYKNIDENGNMLLDIDGKQQKIDAGEIIGGSMFSKKVDITKAKSPSKNSDLGKLR